MKTAEGGFEKGHGTHEKKIAKNKIETDAPNNKFFGGTHEFCFTNMKTVLQKCIPNKPLLMIINFQSLLPFSFLFCFKWEFLLKPVILFLIFCKDPKFGVCLSIRGSQQITQKIKIVFLFGNSFHKWKFLFI